VNVRLFCDSQVSLRISNEWHSLDWQSKRERTTYQTCVIMGTRFGTWLTRDQAKELLAIRIGHHQGQARLLHPSFWFGLCSAPERAVHTNFRRQFILHSARRWVIVRLGCKGGRVRRWRFGLVKNGSTPGRTLQHRRRSSACAHFQKADVSWGRVRRLGNLELSEASAKEIASITWVAHRLLRTCANRCRKNGGDLSNQFRLGPSAIQTTEHSWFGAERFIAVNDNLGL